MALTHMELITKIENGGYNAALLTPQRLNIPEGHVFDENRTVKWNREERERLLKENRASLKSFSERVLDKEAEFQHDLINMIVADTGQLRQATYLVTQSFEEYHDKGLLAVVDAVDAVLEYLLIKD